MLLSRMSGRRKWRTRTGLCKKPMIIERSMLLQKERQRRLLLRSKPSTTKTCGHKIKGRRSPTRQEKTCTKEAQNIEHYMCMKDKDGRWLQDRSEILKCWQHYFKEISNIKFPHLPIQASQMPGQYLVLQLKKLPKPLMPSMICQRIFGSWRSCVSKACET